MAASTCTGCPGDGSSKEFSTTFGAFVEWGEANSLILDESEFPFFKRVPDSFGNEHEVWFYEALNCWFKATYHNQFGIAWGRHGTATAKEYLTRLLLQNKFFADEIRLIAIVKSGERLRVLTSQPHIAGTNANYDEIQEWFLDLGFGRLETDGRIAWYRKKENILVADAHEGNVIKTSKGELVPIDLNMLQPTGVFFKWACDNCK